MPRLSERSVQTAKPGRYVDGDGLILVVTDKLKKKWVLRYQLNGVRRDKGLGAYPEVGLKEARLKVAEDRKLLARGVDPIEARRAAKKADKPIPSFQDVAKLVIADAQRRSTNAKVRYQWERHLGPAYCKALLDRPVNEITTLDVASVLRPVWDKKPEVARKLYPAIRRVFDQARIIIRDEHGIQMNGNAALWDDLRAMGFQPPQKLSRGSHPSLPYAQMSSFIEDLQSRDAMSAKALEFMILTNVRTNAVLKASWADIDLEAAVWTVPLRYLKDRKHRKEGLRIPLPQRAVDILKEMQKVRISEFVFPGRRDQPLSNMAMLTLLKRMNRGEKPKWIDAATGKPITGHGFRASFKTWADEVATFPNAVVEQAMGHQVGTQSERVYSRTDLLDLRRKLMEAWANYCKPRKQGRIIDLKQALSARGR